MALDAFLYFAPTAVVGSSHFDGAGHVTTTGVQTTAGVAKPFSMTGSYSVGANCSINITVITTDGQKKQQVGVVTGKDALNVTSFTWGPSNPPPAVIDRPAETINISFARFTVGKL